MASSLLGFAPIQGIECKKDLAGLTPKRCFIPGKPIEREIGQVS